MGDTLSAQRRMRESEDIEADVRRVISTEQIDLHWRWREAAMRRDMQTHYSGKYTVAERLAVTSRF